MFVKSRVVRLQYDVGRGRVVDEFVATKQSDMLGRYWKAEGLASRKRRVRISERALSCELTVDLFRLVRNRRRLSCEIRFEAASVM